MKGLIIFLLALGISHSSYAHDHNLTTFTIYKRNGAWMMKIDYTTSSMSHALKNQKNLSDKDIYNQSVINYFKDHINIVIDNDAKLDLGTGAVKYGHHSSEVIIVLKNFNPNWNILDCEITAFNSNEEQHNIIRIEMKDHVFKEFLHDENEFKTVFKQVVITN